MDTVTTAIIGQLGIAAIFVVAWFRSEGKRDQERAEANARYETIRIEYNQAQTAHRRELLELIRDIVADPYQPPKKQPLDLDTIVK